MTQFAVDPQALKTTLAAVLGGKANKITVALGEVAYALVVGGVYFTDVSSCHGDVIS